MSTLPDASGSLGSGTLDVGDGQRIFWEQAGSVDGVPAVYLHGGPGSGCQAGAWSYFTSDAFRVVMFDQRGCGRSRPRASEAEADLSTNTTAHQVTDIETLRVMLGIDRWIVVGVSWGVTLALVYAQSYPERVMALVLGAVTAGTRREIDWITRQMGRVFPREWDRLIELVPQVRDHGNIPAAYARLLASPIDADRDEAARRWCEWEDTHVSLMPGWEPDRRYQDPGTRMTIARLVTHYWAHDCFLEPDQILDRMHRIRDVPGWLIHGAHDISSPPDTAWRLHQAWPASTLTLLADAGHGGSGFGDAIRDALHQAHRLSRRS